MNVPVLVLLGFAAWTLLTLFGSIGVYRWNRMRTPIAEWCANLPQGSDWYRRAEHAHMNCAGNLPVYTAIDVALIGTAKSIGAFYNTLQTLGSEIKRFLKEIKLLAGEDEYRKLLQTIPGIGKITSFAFVASIGDPKRIRKSQSVGAHLGMTGRTARALCTLWIATWIGTADEGRQRD